MACLAAFQLTPLAKGAVSVYVGSQLLLLSAVLGVTFSFPRSGT